MVAWQGTKCVWRVCGEEVTPQQVLERAGTLSAFVLSAGLADLIVHDWLVLRAALLLLWGLCRHQRS